MTYCSLKMGSWMVTLRQLGEARRRLGHFVLAVLVIEIDELVAVHSVKRQQDQHDEVRNQQRQVKGVGLIEALESRVEEMRPQVMAKPVWFRHQRASPD